MSIPRLDVEACRQQFPALSRMESGQRVAFFDGPSGTQVPRRVAEAVTDYLLQSNANCGAKYATSRETDQMLGSARQTMASFVGADDPESIVFGPNMTTLTFSFSRAVARTWRAGDEILVTQLDHDANVTPWVFAARDAGVKVQHVNVQPEDCTLDLEDFRAKLSERTRLVAFGAASNAVGTINPVAQLADLAHAVGAEVFVDAVHLAPHALPDVTAWHCDYLVCSTYKFFGPHVGVLWGRSDRLAELEAYKVRPALDVVPEKWMTGTQNHEGIAGAQAAVRYLADLGRSDHDPTDSTRQALQNTFALIGEHETRLARKLIGELADMPSVRVWGIADLDRLSERVPTVAITHQRLSVAELARRLADRGMFVGDGNFYALPLTSALNLEPGGLLRIGFVHYNHDEEVERLLSSLREWD